jgi:hypothetical protein
LGVIWVVVVSVSDGTMVVVDGLVLFLSFFVFFLFFCFLSGMVDGMFLFSVVDGGGRRWVFWFVSGLFLAGVRWWRLVCEG